MIELEGVLITAGAATLGVVLLWLGLWQGQTLLQERFGLFVDSWPLSPRTLALLALVLVVAAVLAAIPAIAAYRQGMATRLKQAG